jgi:hypothetical protein
LMAVLMIELRVVGCIVSGRYGTENAHWV